MSNVLSIEGVPFVERMKIDEEMKMIAQMEQDACFVYVNKGRHDVISPNEHISMEQHESALMKCGNYIACAVGSSPLHPLEMLIFHLDPHAIKKAFGTDKLAALINKNTSIQNLSSVKIETAPLLDNYIQSMEVFFEKPEMANDDLLYIKMQELVLILCQNENSDVIKYLLSNLYQKTDYEFDHIIEKNLFENLTIPELAALTNRSDSTFKRDFKKYYNDSPAKWIKRKKLEKANELLLNTDLSISEIAYECGFENPAHFSTSFLNKYEMAPKKYRMSQSKKSLT